MKLVQGVTSILVLCSCSTTTLPPMSPVQTGTHHTFTAEKRGTCFGDMDRTAVSPELDHWNRTLRTHQSDTLVAWSRDIARGSGCDEHRFNVVQGKAFFDLRGLPRGAVISHAELVGEVIETPTPRASGPRFVRFGDLDRNSCLADSEYFAQVGVTEELVLGPASAGAMMTYAVAPYAEGVAASLREGIGGSRELRADLTRPLTRLVTGGQRQIGVVLSPRAFLDPQLPSGFGVGVVIEPRFDNMYCAAYVSNVTLNITYVARD